MAETEGERKKGLTVPEGTMSRDLVYSSAIFLAYF